MKKASFLLAMALLLAAPAQAFQGADGCGAGECKDCHSMNRQEAAGLLSLPENQVADVKFSEVPGLWVVDVARQGRTMPVYIDFSKQYLISGSVIKLADKKDITRERAINLNRIDVSQVPLEDAVVVGSPAAALKIIVFDDPQCPYCQKLQEEMGKVVRERPDIAFFIKMFPLKIHPEAYNRAKTIICKKSLQLLEESLAGKPLPPPDCETDQIEKNFALAEKLGIRSTPTLIMPDGRVMPGFKQAADIIRLLAEEKAGADAGSAQTPAGKTP
jgi:thiol:disulfide interchange protein DsbC